MRSVTDKLQGASSVCFDGGGYLQIEPSPDFAFAEGLTIDFAGRDSTSPGWYHVAMVRSQGVITGLPGWVFPGKGSPKQVQRRERGAPSSGQRGAAE